MKLKRFLYIFFLLINTSFSQEIPPIQNFSFVEYNAGNQNWMVTENNSGSIFFANNKGLLEFNGNRWSLYPTANQSILRSVKYIQNRIYSGSYMDFGYWKLNDFGGYDYTSLQELYNVEIIENEEFWNILNYGDKIIFQSLNRLVIFSENESEVQYLKTENPMLKSFLIGDQIFYQESNKGLFVVRNGNAELWNDHPIIKTEVLLGLFEYEGELLGLTNKSGFFIFRKNQIEKWPLELTKKIDQLTFYSVLQLSDKSFALGTISNGFIWVDKNGKEILSLDQTQGISNNTVLSVFEDSGNNIWLALDNGIDCINARTPFLEYEDIIGQLGTVYSSRLFQNQLYIGTNQGLFVKPIDRKGNYEFIKDTKGQVWSLSVVNDQLICGHDQGSFMIKGNQATKISDINGSWIFRKLPHNPDVLIQGNYDGIHILEFKDNTWTYKNKLKGYDMSSKFIEIVNDTTFLVSHEYKGVFKLTVDKAHTQVLKNIQLTNVNKGLNASIALFDGQIYYHSPEGFYVFNPELQDFEKDNRLSLIVKNEGYVSGKMVNTDDQILWFFSKNKIHTLTKDSFSKAPKHDAITISESKRKSVNGYEHISSFTKSNYLLSTYFGYLLVDRDRIQASNASIQIDKIFILEENQNRSAVSKFEELLLENNSNNIGFMYSARNYQKYDEVEFQYFLEGYSKEWSQWDKSAEVVFKNLPSGEYHFQIRSKIGDRISEIVESKPIVIRPPWFKSNQMILIYSLLGIIILFLINSYYKWIHKKRQDRLIKKNERLMEIKSYETQKEIMKMKNIQLEKDIENKNRELALSSMQNVKKNKSLLNIKKELKKIVHLKSIDNIVSIIDDDIKNKEDWKFFEEAFNNADKEFFKKVKILHPELTKNDLQLCAYLRLNLTSKEIAPILNISVRSVEIKRYRLRKKMNLKHNKGLVEYILTM